MIRIGICEDEKFMAKNLKDKLQELAWKKKIPIEIELFSDGIELLADIKKGCKFDLLYLDIEMKYKNGIDTAKEVRKLSEHMLIIFVTGYEIFAREAFEVEAFRFLIKPLDDKKFEKYFEDAIKKLEQKVQYFQYRYNKCSYYLPLNEIIYFQSDRRIIYITTNKGDLKCYDKLNTIEKRLKEEGVYFYRIHQSFLVNPRYIKRYRYDFMELENNIKLTISEKYRKQVSELFCRGRGEDIIAF